MSTPVKLASLSAKNRLQLLKFVCSFLWADLDVGPSERTFVLGLAQRMDLSNADMEKVKGWLEAPAPAEEVDPTTIPAEHRRLFLEAVEQAIASDGVMNPPEREFLDLFRELLR